MSELNKQLNSEENREEYIENIPTNPCNINPCACIFIIIIAGFLDFFFCFIYRRYGKK